VEGCGACSEGNGLSFREDFCEESDGRLSGSGQGAAEQQCIIGGIPEVDNPSVQQAGGAERGFVSGHKKIE
jgi:hypothetical protein